MTVLYIASENRSGSTLLDLLLGNHSQMVSVGEVNRLSAFLQQGELCTCGAAVSDCAFWKSVVDRMRADGVCMDHFVTRQRNQPRRIPLPGLTELLSISGSALLLRGGAKLSSSVRSHLESARNTWRVLDAVRDSSGRKIVVDSSKRADQCKLLYLTNPGDRKNFRMIHLVRDGRGTAYSMMTRAGVPFRRATRAWLCNNLMLNAVKFSIPKSQRLFVRYEDLCRDPSKVLKSICEFADVPFEDSLTSLGAAERHNIGGSPHRFNKQRSDITLDERWRSNLTQEQIRFFGRFAGFLNRRFGYT